MIATPLTRALDDPLAVLPIFALTRGTASICGELFRTFRARSSCLPPS